MKTYLKAKNLKSGVEHDVYCFKGLYYIRFSNYVGLLSIVDYVPNDFMFYRHYEFNGKICEVIVV